MSIDKLRYFAAVVETRNIRKASELVGIAPPSMSKAISVLEKELGCKLIHPDGRGIGITPKGLEVYRLSSSLIDEYKRFYEGIRVSNEITPQLRIATFEVFSSYFISAFLKSEPELKVLLLEKTPGSIEAAILSGVADVGITYLPSPENSLDYVEIGSFKMGIFGQKKWEDKAFDEWPFAVPITELKIHSSDIESLDMWPLSAPQRYIKYRFELLETAIQTSREGLSVVHCPLFIVQLQNTIVKTTYQLHALKAPSKYRTLTPTRIFLVARKGTVPNTLERKLAKFIRSLT